MTRHGVEEGGEKNVSAVEPLPEWERELLEGQSEAPAAEAAETPATEAAEAPAAEAPAADAAEAAAPAAEADSASSEA
jgi:small subunit ribosomal protein S2